MADLGTGELELDADTTGLEAGLSRGEKSVYGFATTVKGAGITMQMLGDQMVRAVGSVINVSVSYENAMAGVQKAAGLSTTDLRALETVLIALSMRIPVKFEDIAGIAQAAAEAGIQGVDNLTRVTEAVSTLAAVTTMTADTATKNIARFSAIMGMPIEQVNNFANALVLLAVKTAATENEIADMALALSSTGAVVGLSYQQVLGLADALASLGISTQKAGTAIQRTFSDMADATVKGGATLQTWATVAHMSADEFVAAFKDRPMEALLALVAGLKGVIDAGGNAYEVLGALGINEVRQREVLLRLAAAYDSVISDISLASVGWEQNNAMTQMAEVRFATLGSQMTITHNTLSALARTIGDTLKPAIYMAAEEVAKLARNLGSFVAAHPQLVAVTLAAAAAAGALLILGGTGLIAFAVIATAGPILLAAAGNMGLFTVALIAVAVVIGSFIATWGDMMDTLSMLRDVASTVVDALAAPVEALGGLIDVVGAIGDAVMSSVDVVGSGISALVDIFSSGLGALVDIVATTAVTVYQFLQYLNPFAIFSPSLVDEVTRGIDLIIAKYGTLTYIKGPLEDARVSIDDLKEAVKAVSDVIQQRQTDELDKALALLGEQTPAAYAKAKDAVDTLKDAISTLSDQISIEQTRLDDLGSALDLSKAAHQAIKDEIDKVKRSLRDATDALQFWQDAQLVGTQAFTDQMFDLEQQIARVQLALINVQESASFQTILQQISDLDDQIDGLRDQLSGAEGDARDAIQAQVDSLTDQRDALQAAADGMTQPLQDELDHLQNKAEATRLEERLQLDPLKKKIEETAKPIKEFTFAEIIQGVKDANDGIGTFSGSLDTLQQAETDHAASLKDLQDAYDTQKDKVDTLKDAQKGLNDVLKDFQSTLTDTASIAQSELQKLESATGGAGKAAANLDAVRKAMEGIGDPETLAKLDEAKKKWEEQQQSIQDFQNKIEEFKKNLDSFVSKVQTVCGVAAEIFHWLALFFVTSFLNLITAGILGTIILWKIIWDKWGDDIKKFFGAVWGAIAYGIGWTLNLIGDLIKGAWEVIQTVTTTVWGAISGFFTGWWDTLYRTVQTVLGDIGKLISDTWGGIAWLTGISWGLVQTAVIGVIDVIKAAWNGLGTALKWTWNNVIRPVLQALCDAYNNTIGLLAGIPGIPGPGHIGPVPYVYAQGTNWSPGGLAIVGELGPELVNLPTGSQVHTADETRDLLRATTNYYFQEGSIVIPAKDLDEMRSVQDFFDRLSKVVRTR